MNLRLDETPTCTPATIAHDIKPLVDDIIDLKCRLRGAMRQAAVLYHHDPSEHLRNAARRLAAAYAGCSQVDTLAQALSFLECGGSTPLSSSPSPSPSTGDPDHAACGGCRDVAPSHPQPERKSA